MLNGRFAGKKAVVVKTWDDGSKVGKWFVYLLSKDRKFGHALVAGIERYPRKVTSAMNTKKI